MCRYAQTVMCAVSSVKSSDKKSKRSRFADANVKKYTRWRDDLLPLLDLKIQYFVLHLESTKPLSSTIASPTRIFFFFSPTLFSLRLPLSVEQQSNIRATSRKVYLHICILLLLLLTHFYTGSSDIAPASSVSPCRKKNSYVSSINH